jgi:SynChlorMet cassette protein ScmD
MSTETIMPVASPDVVFRQEFDDWAVLFEPDTGETYGLDPVSSFIWKMLDGKNTKKDILSALEKECEDGIPEDAEQHLTDFVTDLEKHGLVGREV